MSLSEKIVKRVARKDKEDPFIEMIIHAKEVREAVLRLKERKGKNGYKNHIIIHIDEFEEIFGEKLT